MICINEKKKAQWKINSVQCPQLCHNSLSVKYTCALVSHFEWYG